MPALTRAFAAFSLVVALVASPGSQAATEIQFWHAMDGAYVDALSRLVDRFNASQSEVKVIATNHGSHAETLSAGLAAAKAKKPPHILQAHELGAADLAASARLFKPLWQLAAENGMRFERDEYFTPAASPYADAGGRLLALPFNSSTPVLFVNRNLLQKAGLDPDKPPKTWPDMQAMLLELQKSGVDCPYTTATQAWIHLENMSAWHNQPVASHNNGLSGDRPELLFNNRLMIRHVSILSAWVKSDLFRHAGQADTAVAHFANGECALLTASSAALGELRETGRFTIGIASLPHYDDFPNAPYNTLIGGGALWVMAGNPLRDYKAVARFMAYMGSAPIAAEWHQATGYVPMSRAAYLASKRSGFYERNPAQEIGALQLRGAHAGNFARGVRLRHFAQIRAIAEEELNAVWLNGKAPKDAMDDAVERGNALLRRPQPPVKP